MIFLATVQEDPLTPPLAEVIIGLIAFGLVVLVMSKVVAPRFEQIFRGRREAIEGGLERAEAMQAEAREALERYRAQLAEARAEAARIRDEARAEGQAILEQFRATAQEESARLVARGEEELARARQSVVAQLSGEIGALGVELASRIVGEPLDGEAQRLGTVDRFLSSIR